MFTTRSRQAKASLVEKGELLVVFTLAVLSGALFFGTAASYLQALISPGVMLLVIVISLGRMLFAYHVPTLLAKLTLVTQLFAIGIVALWIAQAVRPSYLTLIADIMASPDLIEIGLTEYVEPLDAKTAGYLFTYVMSFTASRMMFLMLGIVIPAIKLPPAKLIHYKRAYQDNIRHYPQHHQHEYDQHLARMKPKQGERAFNLVI